MFSAFLQGFFRGLAPDDSPFQVTARGRQFHRAPAERPGQLMQVDVRLERGAMRFLDRGDGFGKENSRSFDDPIPAAGGFQ